MTLYVVMLGQKKKKKQCLGPFRCSSLLLMAPPPLHLALVYIRVKGVLEFLFVTQATRLSVKTRFEQGTLGASSTVVIL